MVVAVVIIAIVVVAGAYYFLEDSPYETAVISTSNTTGTITGVANASYSLPAAGTGSRPQSVASARIVISTSTGSFTAFLGCWPVKYSAGQTVSVTVSTERNGAHQYSAPKLLCGGGGGAGGFATSTSTSSHSTTA